VKTKTKNSLPSKVRLAVVNETGRRYIVQQADFRAYEVMCWGEVVGYTGTATRHGPSKTFRLNKVHIVLADRTATLADDLLDQTKSLLRDRGIRPTTDWDAKVVRFDRYDEILKTL